jgi:DNA-directed RNA polymerase specialized sigma24 family protein
VLNGTLIRYGVDLEAVSRAVAGAYLRRIGAHLRAHQREDLLAYLVAAAWQISERFDPKRNDDFEGYLTALLSRRPTDWYRLTIVDARHGDIEAKAAIALPYSLDAPAGSQSDPIGDGTTLSPWATEVLELMGDALLSGWTEAEIAKELGVSQQFVEACLRRLRHELNRPEVPNEFND